MILQEKSSARKIATWSIAIFSSRESKETLRATIDAALKAAQTGTIIDVLVNGNASLAIDIADTDGVRVHYVRRADKAHVWNVYLHEIWPDSDLAFFIDGYARVRPDALKSIAEGLEGDSIALAATGVPSYGRSSKALQERMQREGGIHGNLYALRREVLQSFRDSKFYLPSGIYRTDPTIGGIVLFGLDPAQHEWDTRRTYIATGATWEFTPGSILSWRDLKAQWKRTLRQSQGALETAAVRHWLYIERRHPAGMPRTARALILSWAKRAPEDLARVYRQTPFARWAMWRIKSMPDEPEVQEGRVVSLQIRG